MSDYMAAEIRIGGTLSQTVWAQLQQLIVEENRQIDYGGDFFAELTPALLQEHLDFHDGVLRLADEELPWGMFEELERFCQQKQIPFDRQSDGKYEFDPQLVLFRPGREPIFYTTDHSNIAMVCRERVVEARRRLQTGNLSEALRILDELLGPEVPPLPPLAIIEHPDWLLARLS